MSELLDSFFGMKALLIYRCGSHMFGLDESNSDYDYVVITEGTHNTLVYKDDNADYFVFDKEHFKNALTFEGEMTYFLTWLDNVLLAPDHIVYADEDYKKEFLEIINIDWNKVFHKWLERNLEYFYLRLNAGEGDKSLYHLFRVNSLVKHYMETKKFEFYFSEEDRTKAKEFKSGVKPFSFFEDDLKSIYKYLQKVYEEVTR